MEPGRLGVQEEAVGLAVAGAMEAEGCMTSESATNAGTLCHKIKQVQSGILDGDGHMQQETKTTQPGKAVWISAGASERHAEDISIDLSWLGGLGTSGAAAGSEEAGLGEEGKEGGGWGGEGKEEAGWGGEEKEEEGKEEEGGWGEEEGKEEEGGWGEEEGKEEGGWEVAGCRTGQHGDL